MALLASARAIEATKVMNGENNQAKEVADRMPRSLYQNQTEGYVPPAKEMERTMKLVQELENPSTSFRYGPKETQGTSREKTSQPTEKLSSPREAQGIHLKKKVKIARLSGETQSRKEAPDREIPQSTKEAPLRQLEQDKGKEAEPLKLGKEEIDFLQSFLDSLKQNKQALQGFKEGWKDKEFLEGIANLMKDEKIRESVRSELKNKENVKQAILSLENPQVLQDLKKLLSNKEDMEVFKYLMQNKEFRGRALLEAGNNVPWEKLSLKNGTNITSTERADIRARLQGRQDLLNLAEGYNLSTAEFQSARHEIEQSSDQLLAAAWQLDSTHVLVYEELNKPVDNVQTQIHLFKVDEASQTMHPIARNVNGVDTYGPRVVVRDQSQASCPDQCNQYGCCPGPLGPGYPCAYTGTVCRSINLQCSFGYCGSCSLACWVPPVNSVACAACLLAWCLIGSFIGCCDFGPGLMCEPPSYCNC